MARPRRVFGPLFYATVFVSVALLGGYGGWLGWQSVAQAWEMRGLVRQLGDPSSRIRWHAAGQLVQMGTDAVPAVLQALKDPEPRVRLMACKTLPSLDPEAQAAVPALVAVLQDSDAKVRRAAAFDLGLLYHASVIEEHGSGRITNEIVRALRASLHDLDERVRRVSAESLTYCGPNAGPAVVELTDALSDTCGDVRLAAARTLLQVNDGSRPAVINALRELSVNLAVPLKNTPRANVLTELEILEPGTRTKVAPKLVCWLNASEPTQGLEAIALFKSLGPDARAVVSDLEHLLASRDLVTRTCAGMALAWVDPTARDQVLPMLVASAKDDSFHIEMRGGLFDLIRELAPNVEVELGAVVRGEIRQGDAKQRLGAIELLRHLDQGELQAAASVLAECAQDIDKPVAEAAREALSQIKPAPAKGITTSATALK